MNKRALPDRAAILKDATMHQRTPRYAIYFAPSAGSALARLGWQWLGRGPDRIDSRRRMDMPGIGAAERDRVLTDAIRYGFHATLKAPFRLVGRCEAADLVEAAARFAAAHPPLEGPALGVSLLSGFLALQPQTRFPALDILAADCVVAFDSFRAPLTESEIVQRQAVGLSPRQTEYLLRWGYPYVLDEFRFHMTLTAPLPPERLLAWWRVADTVAQPLRQEPFRVTEICVFCERAPGTPFRLYARFPLAG